MVLKTLKLGDTSPTRDFNYVEDTCRGFLQLAQCDNTIGETVNIGSGFEVSIADLLESIKNIMGSDIDLMIDKQRLRPKGSEVSRLCCDNKKIKQLTGFEPKTNLQQGLQQTIEWFTQAENLRRYKSSIYNI